MQIRICTACSAQIEIENNNNVIKYGSEIRAGRQVGIYNGNDVRLFCGKSGLFKELVGEAADKLLDYFSGTEDEFATFSPKDSTR